MAFSELRDTLRIRLPGAIDGLINLELFNVVDELCRNTNAYRETVEVTLVAGQTEYAVTPANREILLVYSVAHETLDVAGTTYDSGTLSLPNAPAAADVATALVLDVSLAPLHEATPENWLTTALWQTFHQALVDGTLARMMSQLAKPYSSERMATYHQRRFRNWLAMLRTRKPGDSRHGPQDWTFPRHTR